MKEGGIDMLLFSKKINKAGCASVGVILCASVGYNGDSWSM